MTVIAVYEADPEPRPAPQPERLVLWRGSERLELKADPQQLQALRQQLLVVGYQ